jgi:hypothetical protein
MMNNNRMGPMQLAQALRQGGNPKQVIAQYAQQSPTFQGTMQRINGRTPMQILEMAQQMARESNIDLNQLAQQLGVTLPK